MNFFVAEKQVLIDFPCVQNFTAKRKNGLIFFIASLLSRTARRVTFHQEEFIAGNIAARAIRKFARKNRNRRSFSLFDFLSGMLARLCLLDKHFSKLAALFNVAVEPELHLRTHKAGNQLQRISADQFFFGLSLELRVQYFCIQDKAGTRKHVIHDHLDAFSAQAMGFHETSHGLEDAVAQTSFMSAAERCRNQVHVALTFQLTFICPANDPAGAFALRKGIVVRSGKALSFERLNQRRTVQLFGQIFLETAFVFPDLFDVVFFIAIDHLAARKQNCLTSQEADQLVLRNRERVEILSVRPAANPRSGRFLWSRSFNTVQRHCNKTVLESN